MRFASACIASTLRLTQLHHLTAVDVPYQSVGSLNWSVIGTHISGSDFSKANAKFDVISRSRHSISLRFALRPTTACNKILPSLIRSIFTTNRFISGHKDFTESPHLWDDLPAGQPRLRAYIYSKNVWRTRIVTITRNARESKDKVWGHICRENGLWGQVQWGWFGCEKLGKLTWEFGVEKQ